MDDARIDGLAKAIADGRSRRSLLKGLLGLGSAVAIGRAASPSLDAEAARRPTPTPTPKPVICPGQQIWDGSACVCQSGYRCGPTRCGSGQQGCAGFSSAECCAVGKQCSIIQPAGLQPVGVCCDGNRAACIDTTTAELFCCPEGQICQHHQSGAINTYTCVAPG